MELLLDTSPFKIFFYSWFSKCTYRNVETKSNSRIKTKSQKMVIKIEKLFQILHLFS